MRNPQRLSFMAVAVEDVVDGLFAEEVR